MVPTMADTLTIPLAPELAERLRQLAQATGESVEALAKNVLEDTVAEFGDAMGDDDELRRRIEAWKADRVSTPAEEVHQTLQSLRPSKGS
jgi:predicted transcriptional regulator